MSKNSENKLETTNSRRDFFKKTAAYSVSAITAASILAPATLSAEDDHNIIHHTEWGTTLGDELKIGRASCRERV